VILWSEYLLKLLYFQRLRACIFSFEAIMAS
jgi:hypothetical protein